MKITVVIILFVAFNSCSKKVYKVSREAQELISYKSGDELIFNNGISDSDTILIERVDSFISPSDPLDVFPRKIEHYIVYSKTGEKSSSETKLLSISRNEKGETLVNINFRTSKSKFYGPNNFTLQQLNGYKVEEVKIGDTNYEDVWIFDATNRKFEERDNFIERLYWSKSKGIIKYEKKGNEVWELKI